MKIWKPFIILAVAAALLPATILPVAAQGLVGKSIEVNFTYKACLEPNKPCLRVPIHLHYYVGSAGHLYDFTGPQKGDAYTLGVRAPDGRLYTIQDNKLAIQLGAFTRTYSVNGTGCSISDTWSDNDHHPNQVQNPTCVVTDGPPHE
jgi:hypothetical protein